MRSVALDLFVSDPRDYVDLVRSGEVVQVIERGQVVVEIRPPAQAEAIEPEWFAKAVAEGKIKPATNRHAPLPKPTMRYPLKQILSDLDDDRADR